MLSPWPRFRYGKSTHLRREMGAALMARASQLCITSQADPPRLFFLFLFLFTPAPAQVDLRPPPSLPRFDDGVYRPSTVRRLPV